MAFITPRGADFWRPWIVAALLAAIVGAVFVGMDRAHGIEVRASFYDHGSRTASGARFDWHALTAASRDLPFGTLVKACLDACAIVTVTDRGPFVEGRGMDFSRGAARVIGLERRGVALVRVEVLGRAVRPHRF